jgi:hypothetical protein
MRRIYTDGRQHPEDPDLTLHGNSIGHWEDDTLVVDTTAIMSQAFIAISEAVGVPNNGDMHVVERLHLAAPNVLHDDLEITAPKVLTTTWKSTRIFRRYPDRHYEITEGGSSRRTCFRARATSRSSRTPPARPTAPRRRMTWNRSQT